jgi:hypothetical protein
MLHSIGLFGFNYIVLYNHHYAISFISTGEGLTMCSISHASIPVEDKIYQNEMKIISSLKTNYLEILGRSNIDRSPSHYCYESMIFARHDYSRICPAT